MNNTLSKAYNLIYETSDPYLPELQLISHVFIRPDIISSFHNSELYLHFLKAVIRESFNVSFPDTLSSYHIYIEDCLALKEALEADDVFDLDLWLSYIVKLLEALKTPYYHCLSVCLKTFTQIFKNRKLAEKALAVCYSKMIKSDVDRLYLIEKLCEHFPGLAAQTAITEELLCSILSENLILFTDEKTSPLLSEAKLFYEDFTSRELTPSFCRQFMEDYLKEQTSCAASLCSTTSPLTFSEFAAERISWISSHQHHLLIRGAADSNKKISCHVDSDFLNTYAYNMCEVSYITDPAIGRDQEIADLELILLSPKKSPIIFGEAGVGKTSIVEGLAYRIAGGHVSSLMAERRIFKLTTTALLSGTKYVGEMEERMKLLTAELKKHPEVILFIDEFHTVVGAGSTESSNNDISNMLKPYIDRGDIKIIGATTTDEYHAFIGKDKALARRFYPVFVGEPDEETTFRILLETIPSIEYRTGVKNTFDDEQTGRILEELIEITKPENQVASLASLRPELPLTILEMAFSYAALRNAPSLSPEDLNNAVAHSNRLSAKARATQWF